MGLGGLGRVVGYVYPGPYGDARVTSRGEAVVAVNGFPLLAGGPIESIRLSDKDKVDVLVGKEMFGPLVFQGS